MAHIVGLCVGSGVDVALGEAVMVGVLTEAMLVVLKGVEGEVIMAAVGIGDSAMGFV